MNDPIIAILIDPAGRSMLPVSIPTKDLPEEGMIANDLDHAIVREVLGFPSLQAIRFPFPGSKDWAYACEDNLELEPSNQEFDTFEVGAYTDGYRLSSRALVYGFDVRGHRYSTPKITIEELSGMITWSRCLFNGFHTKYSTNAIEIRADWTPLKG